LKLVIGELFLEKDKEVLEELRRIRTALETKPPPPQPAPTGLWAEFKDFLSKYKVFGLAVAFILGLYAGTLIQALVKDLLMPLIGLVLPGIGNLASYKVGVPSVVFDAAGNPPEGYTGQVFGVGDFLVALITFIIVAFVIFIVVKVAKRMRIE
jgi:large conductance mechanosensitive channel